jgi:hypothetical protein
VIARFRGLLVLAAACCASCAAPQIKFPSGPGTPAADGLEILDAATKSCRGIRTISLEAGVSGKVNGERLRARLLIGAAAPSSARIEAPAPFGAPAFILVSARDEATLLLPRDNRVLEHARLDEILSALTGVPLTADELRLTLSGCWPDPVVVRKAVEFGADWRMVIVEADDALYLHRENANASWRLVGVHWNIEHAGRSWNTQYGDVLNDLPRSIRIASADASSSYDLRLSLSQVDTNVPLDADVFRVQIPASAKPITLEELRHARPGTRED